MKLKSYLCVDSLSVLEQEGDLLMGNLMVDLYPCKKHFKKINSLYFTSFLTGSKQTSHFLFDRKFTHLDERGGNGGGRRENMGTTGLSLCVFGGVGTWQNTFFKYIIN